jgi:hypothetical protein
VSGLNDDDEKKILCFACSKVYSYSEDLSMVNEMINNWIIEINWFFNNLQKIRNLSR